MNRRIKKKRAIIQGFKSYKSRRHFIRCWRFWLKQCLMQQTWWKYKDTYLPPLQPELDRIYWRCYRERKLLNEILGGK